MNTRSNTFLSDITLPSGDPWISEQMPWSNPLSDGIMQFTAVPTNFPGATHKRKSSIEHKSHVKQRITEEKMTATLNGLHISHDFVAHNSNIATEQNEKQCCSSENSNEEVMEADVKFSYPLYAKDLKQARYIKICEEFQNITNTEPIIPKALLEHYEKPCKALVIWQPPPKIKDLILYNSSVNQNKLKSEDSSNSNNNNNNNTLVGSNYNNITMETDMF